MNQNISDATIYVRVPQDLKEWIEAEAEKMAMPISTYVRFLIVRSRQSADGTSSAP